MVDHIRVNRRVSLLPVGFAIAVFSAVSAISTAAARPAQEASPVKYITNDLGLEFAPIPAGQFPMLCPAGRMGVVQRRASESRSGQKAQCLGPVRYTRERE